MTTEKINNDQREREQILSQASQEKVYFKLDLEFNFLKFENKRCNFKANLTQQLEQLQQKVNNEIFINIIEIQPIYLYLTIFFLPSTSMIWPRKTYRLIRLTKKRLISNSLIIRFYSLLNYIYVL